MGVTRLAAILVTFVLMVDVSVLAWKWRKFFDDSDSDSVVTVAADGRSVYPVFRTYNGYRTVLVRVPVVSDFGPPVITRLRHVYRLPPPPPPPPPPPAPLSPVAATPATRYGVPHAVSAPPTGTNSAASTAAAVAAAVARTILEAHGFSRSFQAASSRDVASGGGRTPWNTKKEAILPTADEVRGLQRLQGLYWDGGAAWRR